MQMLLRALQSFPRPVAANDLGATDRADDRRNHCRVATSNLDDYIAALTKFRTG